MGGKQRDLLNLCRAGRAGFPEGHFMPAAARRNVGVADPSPILRKERPMPGQFVIQMDSHPGGVASLARSFAARGVEIHQVACVGTGPLACIFTVDDAAAGREVLQGLGVVYLEGHPLIVDVDDHGGLGEVTKTLEAAGVHVTGMFAVGRHAGRCEMSFCVDDEEAARVALGMASPLHEVIA
jgi:hypothetical protein